MKEFINYIASYLNLPTGPLSDLVSLAQVLNRVTENSKLLVIYLPNK